MSPKLAVTLVLLAGLFFPATVSATDRDDPDTTGWTVPTEIPTMPPEESIFTGKDFRFDLSRVPMPWRFGPIVVGAFHVSLARDPGPHRGPPTRIWGLGFGTTLWTNPVTGWQES